MTITDDTAVFDAVGAANGYMPDLNNDGVQEFPSQLPPSPARTADDADAPYGRTKTGAPRRKPGPSKGTRVGAAIPKINRPGPRSAPRAARKTGTDYRAGILGVIQIPAFMLSAAGQFNEAFALDGAALSMHAPGIAEALNDLAADNVAVAAALDRVLSAGPYGAILGALIPLALQIAANHKAIPDAMARGGGALPSEEFKAALIAQQPRTE